MTPKKFTESGQALVVIALAAVVLFGFAALAIDGSAKFSDRRHAQNAADTAALAGALAYVNNDSTWDVVARSRADDNGYSGDLINDQVWVFQCNDPDRLDPDVPLNCGSYEGNEDYIEVIILSHVNTTFARVFGWDQFHNLVQAVTLAKKGKNLADGAMVISYDPDPNCSTGGTGGYSVSVSGSSTVNLNGGGIFMNSDEVCGFVIPNCADLKITGGAGISSVGGNNIDQGSCLNPAPEFPNQDAIIIPEDVYWPDVPSECSMGGYPTPTKLGEIMVGAPPKKVEEWLIYPGFYTDFPSPGLVANKSNIYMAPGVYCIDPPMNQDLSWSPIDAARLIGSLDPSENKYRNLPTGGTTGGVTLYIKSGGGFSINSNNPTYLDAPASGDYQGYLIILEGNPTSHPSCSITGGADIDINGMIYAPYCNITVNGDSSSTAVINAQLIGWDIKINGGAGVNFNYNPSNQVIIKRRIGLMK